MFNSILAPAAGRFYPKLTGGNLNPGAYAFSASAEINTWNSYISPSDSTGKYNTFADTTEYVDGNNQNLPGSTNSRTLTMGLTEGRFDQLPFSRFDRVVNYFTGKRYTRSNTDSYSSKHKWIESDSQYRVQWERCARRIAFSCCFKGIGAVQARRNGFTNKLNSR